MQPSSDDPRSTPPPPQVVGPAVQNLAAARLGRGFIPLAALFLLGLGQVLVDGWRGAGPLVMTGAPLSAAAMLAYGLRTVQTAFGRERRGWMTMALLGSVLPPAFALYVLAWPGLRTVARWDGPSSVVPGLLYAVLGLWALRAWLKLLELHRLSEVMSPEPSGSPEGM